MSLEYVYQLLEEYPANDMTENYLVSSSWFSELELNLSQDKQVPPIDNNFFNFTKFPELFTQFLVVSSNVWTFLVENFGGGPPFPFSPEFNTKKLTFYSRGEWEQKDFSVFSTVAEIYNEFPGDDFTICLYENGKLINLDSKSNLLELKIDENSKIVVVENLSTKFDYQPQKNISPVQNWVVFNKNHHHFGLKNQGSSCFFNSVIQILSHTDELLEILRNYQWQSGGFISEFISFCQNRSFPDNLFSICKQTIFQNDQPYDASEFLMSFLSRFEEEFSRKRAEIDSKTFHDLNGNVMLHPNPIVNLFYGQIENKVQCNQCTYSSSHLESFLCFPLSIPGFFKTKKQIIYIPFSFKEEIQLLEVDVPFEPNEFDFSVAISNILNSSVFVKIGSVTPYHVSWRIDSENIYAFQVPDIFHELIPVFIFIQCEFLRDIGGPFLINICCNLHDEFEIRKTISKRLSIDLHHAKIEITGNEILITFLQFHDYLRNLDVVNRFAKFKDFDKVLIHPSITLKDCFTEFSLSSFVDFKCDLCGSLFGTCSSHLSIPPPIFIILLRRSSQDRKDGRLVNFPEVLNLKEISPTLLVNEPIYQLYGVIFHSGEGITGHNGCFIKLDGEWVMFDDESVRFVSCMEVFKSCAYLLFYRKKNQH